jgi:hypothetical protein
MALYGQQNQVKDIDMKIVPDQFILMQFDAEGVWQGVPTRKIIWDGAVIDIDEYSASSGLVLPDSGE